MTATRPCEVCGASDPEPVLRSERLDGPLVRCRSCGLLYVGRRERDFTFATTDPARSGALAERVEALELVDHDVEEAEAPWRSLVHEQRLAAIARHGAAGRLLDVGCSTGEFIAAAAAAGFQAQGIEPDPATSRLARERTGLPVTTGTLADAALPAESADVATLWHVIEHLDSPRAALEELRRVLAPGGLVAIETPAADSLWFRLLRGRWRQLIPDHYFFFSRSTLARLLRAAGFDVVELEKVGRRVSGRFLADRLRRVHPALGAVGRGAVRLARAEERTLRINPGDIMLAVAKRRD